MKKTSPLQSVKHRTDNHRIRCVSKVIESLISDVSAESKSYSSIHLFRGDYKHAEILESTRCGFIRSASTVTLWLYESDKYEAIKIWRDGYPLTRSEIGVLKQFEKSLDGTFSDTRLKFSSSASALSPKYTLGNSLIASSIKGANSKFWTIALICDELQELALQRYEGRPCNSGFIYISQPEHQLVQLKNSGFHVDKFDTKVELFEGFFRNTVAHRYVDGRNSFYLIDNNRNIYGVARINRPGDFSIYDRSAFKHFSNAFDVENGKLYAAYVGRNNDVIIKGKGNVLYKWNRLFWKAIDLTILDKVLVEQTSLPEPQRDALVACLLTCSDLRYGTLIAIVDKDVPSEVGRIDASDLAQEVLQVNLGKPILELKNNGSALGILTSDGCTTLDQKGRLLATGSILNLELPSGLEVKLQGGGRTQAAQAASIFGLAIKVSEDGPITFYRSGKKIVQIDI